MIREGWGGGRQYCMSYRLKERERKKYAENAGHLLLHLKTSIRSINMDKSFYNAKQNKLNIFLFK